MESITVQELERDCSEKPCFYQTYAANTHSYTNYFAANQDSRTGILSLLYSAFIPFHAYADRDVEQYERMAKSPSLVDALRTARYSPAFAASVLEHERVIRDLPWARTFYLNEEEAGGGGRFTCLHPYEFERSCEDRILLDREISFLTNQAKPFLLHEFIYGHSSDYNERNHVSSVRYYSDYIEEIMTRLKERGMLQDTLVIVTSDHGIRDRAAAVRPESYHIPLFFISPHNVASSNSELFGHLDFRRILAAEEQSLPVHSARQFLPVMGSTGSAMTGILYGKRGLVLIKNHRFGARAIETSCENCIPPADITPALEEYRRVFRKTLLPAPHMD